MKLRTSLAHCAPMFAMALTASAAALIVAVGYAPDDAPLRTVIIGSADVSQSPAEWTARVITDGWAATDAADRARACQATPAQLRAAAPHTSYDPARYDVETAITTLALLCGKA